AGDIAACVGLKDVTTGETLCDPSSIVMLERMVFPEPVIAQAVEPKTKVDQEKMGIALNRLAQEDPSFRVRTDEESGQNIKGGVVPREFIPAVEKGINEAVTQGVLAGYPVVDVKVTLHFGSYHDVDSNELAFKMAAIFGFKEGCRKASPVILEPMMAVEVETPEDYAGNVMGDLSSRRGMVQG